MENTLNTQTNEHDPDNDVRKIIYDCIDYRIINNNDESVPTYLIINQHGFLGYIMEKDGKFYGMLNNASAQFLANNKLGGIESETFDDCIKGLTDFHVNIFHFQSKALKTEGKDGTRDLINSNKG